MALQTNQASILWLHVVCVWTVRVLGSMGMAWQCIAFVGLSTFFCRSVQLPQSLPPWRAEGDLDITSTQSR